MGRLSARRDGGFTLIELLVVMAIIATLAGLGMVGVPRMLRQKNITAAKARLAVVHRDLMAYEARYQHMPTESGEAFVLGPWIHEIVDHTAKDAEIYFDPSTGNKPDEDLTNVHNMEIDWTGPDQEGRRKKIMTTDLKAAEKIIVCNAIPEIQGEDDLDELPHAAKGIVYLTLSGATDFEESSKFSEGYPVIGPASSNERFQGMKPPREWGR